MLATRANGVVRARPEVLMEPLVFVALGAIYIATGALLARRLALRLRGVEAFAIAVALGFGAMSLYLFLLLVLGLRASDAALALRLLVTALPLIALAAGEALSPPRPAPE